MPMRRMWPSWPSRSTTASCSSTWARRARRPSTPGTASPATWSPTVVCTTCTSSWTWPRAWRASSSTTPRIRPFTSTRRASWPPLPRAPTWSSLPLRTRPATSSSNFLLPLTMTVMVAVRVAMKRTRWDSLRGRMRSSLAAFIRLIGRRRAALCCCRPTSTRACSRPPASSAASTSSRSTVARSTCRAT